MTNTDSALIIFVRNPEPGKVKTRLAKTIGDEKALYIYKKLLEHTAMITANLSCSKFVFYAGNIMNIDLWDNNQYIKRQQQGNDLGDRMHNAFQTVFAHGFRKVAIIGSDCYELSQEILQQAFAKLDEHDTVIGPSKDGGYYLLGMKSLLSAVFKNKQWSTETVLQNTVNDISSAGHTLFLLPLLTDIDEEENIPAELMETIVHLG